MYGTFRAKSLFLAALPADRNSYLDNLINIHILINNEIHSDSKMLYI